MQVVLKYKPEYENEKRLFLSARGAKKPIKHKNTGIYRQQMQDGKEYIFFHEHLSTLDYFGNYLDHTRLIGRYEKPIIHTQYGMNTTQIRGSTPIEEIEPGVLGTEVSGHETVYEFEFSRVKNQLLKFRSENIIDNDTKLYIWATDGRKYAKPYTWDEFINLSFQDLLLLGKFGRKFVGVFSPEEISSKILSLVRDSVKEELTKSPKIT